MSAAFTARLSFTGLALLLHACDGNTPANITAPEVQDSFTFKGELPENFGITAVLSYFPLEPYRPECQEDTWFGSPNKFVIRRKGERKVAPISKHPQSFSFNIPLKQTKETCEMELAQFGLYINSRYGERKGQESSGGGGFWLMDTPRPGKPVFDANGVMNLVGECRWSFKDLSSRTQSVEITKILDCRGAVADLPIKQLAEKVIDLKITLNSQQEPAINNRWIQFENGWKPCKGTEKSNRCQTPPTFKTFLMNGKTCTIYPGCTE